jgi:hypothetical protein
MTSAKVVMLILRVIMPGETPDVTHMQKMESVQACMEAAGEYLSHDLSEAMREKGALGLGATCAFHEQESQAN